MKIVVEKCKGGFVAKAISSAGKPVLAALGKNPTSAKSRLKKRLEEKGINTLFDPKSGQVRANKKGGKLYSHAGVIHTAKKNIEFRKAKSVGKKKG